MGQNNENRHAFRIAAYFAVIGLIWIYGSDYIVEIIPKNIEEYRWIQSIKGSFFVLSVSCIIYILVRNLLQKINAKNISVISSEKRLRETLENLIEGCQMIDFNWKYIYLNSGAAEHGRKSKEALLGKTMFEVYPGIEKSELFVHLKNCMENRIPHKLQNKFQFPDGTYSWFELSIEPNPEGIFILSYDITKRKLAQLALQKSTERLIDSQRIAKLGDFEWHYKSGKVTWSEGLYELLGYNKSDSIDYDHVNKEIHHPDDAKRVASWLKKSVLAKRQVLDPLEYRVIKKNKSIIYVRTSGVIDYTDPESPVVFAIVQDITQLQNYIREIEDKNSFIQTVLDNLPIGVALNKLDEGKATYMNKKFVEIYGWPESELTDVENFFKKVYPDKEYREKISKEVYADIQSGDPSRMHWENISITQQNGDKRIINAVNIPLSNQNTMVSTVMDFTELKNYQEKIIHAMEKAQESDRLKSAFLANMSHEIRTPLNGIMGFSEIMLSAKSLSEEAKKKYTDIIQSCSEGLLQIVNDILDISSLESGNFHLTMKQFELNRLLDELLTLFNSKIKDTGSDCELILKPFERNLSLYTDEDRLRQIFINLLDNAIKFTEKGAIKYGIHNVDKDSITFYVSDSGIGIPNKYHQLIFNRFRQAELSESKVYGGNGLGLSIIKELLKLMHGEIWLDSEKNKGATFYFKIPFDENIQKTELQLPNQNTLYKSKSKLKILIVEDYQINTMYLKEVLKSIDSDIVDTTMGCEAIEFARNNTFDIILMDIRLPDMSGLDAVKKIREFDTKVFIIAQTAYAMATDEERAISAGCNAYVSKPINKEVLFAKFSEAMI